MNSRHYVIVAASLILAAPALAQVSAPERTPHGAPAAAARYSNSAATGTSRTIPDSALDIETMLSLHEQALAQINGSYPVPPPAKVVARAHH